MIFNVGIYIRLSREDNDKIEISESIANQKSLLLQYVEENKLKLIDIYIDDGYSGTNFNRPGFNRMIADIELGKINTVITKDMSRLGRDYIGTGDLIEKYFPEHNVRYIAVTDNVDTFLDNSNNDIAPFKAIMNDMYAKDISKKIRSSLRAKQKEGKWVGGRTPFGYHPDSRDKNHLVINEEQAIIVRRIFEMCLDGLSYFDIAKQLTNEGIKTPAQYYNFEWKNNYNFKYGKWHPKTIKDILNNRMYIGDMVQNKRRKLNYKVKKVIKNNPKDYIIVEDTHEAILTKEIFYEVQKRLPKNVGKRNKKERHLLDGLLFCGNCGHRISITPRRAKDNRCYTICNHYRTHTKENSCTTHSNNYDTLEQQIMLAITQLCRKSIDKDTIVNSIYQEYLKADDSKKISDDICSLKERIKKSHDYLDSIYMDKLTGVIDIEQYNRAKSKIMVEIDSHNKKITSLDACLISASNNSISPQRIEAYIADYMDKNIYDRELIINLINRIDIYEDKSINIYVDFLKN